MSRLSFAAHPHMLGFEQLDRLLERSAKAGSEGYPPYNIELTGENAYRITLAVAGFGEGDLEITLADGQLVIRGRAQEEAGERQYLHRGIAARQFQRSFVLAEHVQVEGAHLENGLLHVDLVQRRPEPVVETIAIGRRDGALQS
ncbi:MAG: Hsp20 family protein [Paracoccaceae bacterium]